MPTATTIPSPAATAAGEAKGPDLFKPLYKRDRALQTSAPGSLPAAIMDPRLPVAVLNANPSIPYTFRTQPYRLQPSIHDDDCQVGVIGAAAGGVDIRNAMDQIFSEHGFLDEEEKSYSSNDNIRSSSNRNGKSAIDEIPIKVLTIDELPGAAIIPGFLPVAVQARLVELVVEELIGDPRHKSNLDAHYLDPHTLLAHLFSTPPPPAPSQVKQQKQAQAQAQEPVLELLPRDPAVHAPLSLGTIRDKKLRWITLGGQYNWTTKVYPSFTRTDPAFPQFPPRVAALFSPPLFAVRPEAAIVNFYSQGDVLSPHQDVAEKCSADLISLSVGCDAIFYIGLDRYASVTTNDNDDDNEKKKKKTNNDTNDNNYDNNNNSSGDKGPDPYQQAPRPPLQVLLRSGDILIMGGAARFAYHGVGRVFRDTAPPALVAAVHPRYRAWLTTKRINLNGRKMLF
jgi:alkylated DNA repair dioxygenase AlkB